MPYQPADANSEALRSGASPSLDGPPPHFPPRPAGADTDSLLGSRPDSDISGGEGMQSPLAKTVAAIAMIMQGANILQSIFGAGAPSPQWMMETQQMSVSLPEAAKQLAQMSSPLGMLGAGMALAPGGGIGGTTMPGSSGMGMGMGTPMMPSLEESANVNTPSGPPQRRPM